MPWGFQIFIQVFSLCKTLATYFGFGPANSAQFVPVVNAKEKLVGASEGGMGICEQAKPLAWLIWARIFLSFSSSSL